MKSFVKVNLIGEMNTRTQMVLTLVNSAVIILLVYVHIDTGEKGVSKNTKYLRSSSSFGMFCDYNI